MRTQRREAEATENLDELTRRALEQMQQMQPPKEEAAEPAAEPQRLPPPPQPHGGQSLLQFLRLDSDALLILPLVLLLGRDGADNALLLALLYIML